MKQHNLYSANGYELNYPHFTKWGGGEVHTVSDPENKIEVGDEVFLQQKVNEAKKQYTPISITDKKY